MGGVRPGTGLRSVEEGEWAVNRDTELSNAFLDLADTLVSDQGVADLLYRLEEPAHCRGRLPAPADADVTQRP